MCVVNKCNSKYEVAIVNFNDDPICSLFFSSISLLALFLSDFNFDAANCYIVRISDTEILDPHMLLDVWNSKEFINEL